MINATIRKLSCTHERLLDKDKVCRNADMYNPSADGPYIYVRMTAGKNYTNTNMMCIYNTMTKTISLIDSPAALLKPTVNMYTGLEDLRIICFQDRLWFTANTTHASDSMENEVVVGHFDKDITKVERIWVIDTGVRPVKNLCPFVYKGRLHVIDVLREATYTLEYQEDTDTFVATKHHDITFGAGMTPLCRGLRGSTSPIHLHGNTWGFVAHSSIMTEAIMYRYPLCYMHYWVEMDMERGSITYVSAPFFVKLLGIEYVSGIKYERDTGRIILYAGENDQQPLAAVTSLYQLRN